MYPTPEDVKRHAAERPDMPLILCEYSHAMGNSSGGLKEYWDIFYSGTNAQGAFVWDWVDQGIRLPVPAEYRQNTPNAAFYAYGGWWEDKNGIRNDNDFNNNGLVAADRTPHPGLYAIKYVYRNLHVTAVDLSAGKVKGEELVRLHQRQGHRHRAVGSEGRRAHHRERQVPRTRHRSRSRRGLHAAAAQDRGRAGRRVLAQHELRPEPRNGLGRKRPRVGLGSIRPAAHRRGAGLPAGQDRPHHDY
jgi:beta-galactosidase/beta-glucuronidase